jgi:pyrroline-5-carboxylate reductase
LGLANKSDPLNQVILLRQDRYIDLEIHYPSIGFIGAGNMATALIRGILAKGYPENRILACDPSAEQLDSLAESINSHKITTSLDSSAANDSDILVLAVKPQIVLEVAKKLSAHIDSDALIVSVAAGITLELLQSYLKGRPTVRCMPNTPALLGEGASGLFASDNTTQQQKDSVSNIFESVGIVEWLNKETDLDLVTAVSGSGPAYFFLFMEAMIDTAVEMGLDRDAAYRLCVQTSSGASLMAAQNQDIAELRKRVTSPNGTTEKAIAAFENGGIRALVKKAMQDCADRSVEMAKEAANE